MAARRYAEALTLAARSDPEGHHVCQALRDLEEAALAYADVRR
jgi:hypothetical protein